MAKRARPKPFNESRLRAENLLLDRGLNGSIAQSVGRGLIRGLLTYFSAPERRKDLDKVYLDVLEDALLAEAQILRNKDVKIVADRVRHVIKDLLAHPSYDVLAEEVARLLPVLDKANYSGLLDEMERKYWLRENLPKILRGLMIGSRCPLSQASDDQPVLCQRRTEMPPDKDISQWARSTGHLELLYHILAHHHGSTYATVREHYKRPDGRRSPGNRGRKPPKRKRLRVLTVQIKKGSPPRTFYSFKNVKTRKSQ